MQMGGMGDALEAALRYSNWVFAGSVLVWLFNSLSAVIRGTGNMAFPALVTCAGVPLLVLLSQRGALLRFLRPRTGAVFCVAGGRAFAVASERQCRASVGCALGGWLVLRWGGTLTQVFIAQAVAMVLYGLVNAFAVAGGAWFGPLGWPRFSLAVVARSAVPAEQ